MQVNDCSIKTPSSSNKYKIKRSNESFKESAAKHLTFDDSSNFSDLPSGQASYIQKYMSIHISEKELREEIFSVNLVFKNVKMAQKLKDYIKELLIEIMKNAVINQEKNVKGIQHKRAAIFPSSTKHCNLMEYNSRLR